METQNNKPTQITPVKVALVGNPNSGKTTIFNAMTGSRQHVGNYPGVTVERKHGHCRFNGSLLEITDLPGTYSLTAVSEEEVVTRNFIIDEQPAVVVNIVDCSNLERNLYLTVQLLELGTPVILVLNMFDTVGKNGLKIDIGKLSKILRVPVVTTVGHKNIGTDSLLQAIVDFSKHIPAERPQVDYGLDRDPSEVLIADRRYGFISEVVQESCATGVEFRHDLSDHIDAVATHPVLGLPIFLGLMYLTFYATFAIANPLTRLMEYSIESLAHFLNGFWPVGTDNFVRSLLVDGIIGGVGGVVVFLPTIVLLFLAIAILEDSGYMARAAFIMDRFMHRIGLHGKSFIPMLIGFGCSVPAIMGTRILENRRDRLTTIMIIPLMSCGARLTIYSLFIPAFFPRQWQAPILWLVYVIGIVLAAVLAKVLRVFVLPGESEGLVMELPPYRMPTAKGLFFHMWFRGWMYLRKAGTVILVFSIILWAMTSFPKPSKEVLAKIPNPGQRRAKELEFSTIGRIGKVIEPAIKPLGFDWRIGTALIGAIPAKEMFVAQMGILFSADETVGQSSQVLTQKLREHYTPLTAFCLMIFCLVSSPCLATLAVTRKETHSWFWALVQFSGLTGLGYLLTLLLFQLGSRIL
jgi:ferrous iron transport protein B